jgi:hypothetical protein
LSAILGIAAGATLGYSEGAQLGESMGSLEPVGAAFAVSDFASRQFHHADADHARQAAMLEISVHQQLRAVQHDSAVDGRLGLAYVRLAMVEEAAGNKEAERQALEQARVWFPPSSSGRKPSDEQLKDFLKRTDGNGLSTRSGPGVKLTP